jgi:hypothetical protein
VFGNIAYVADQYDGLEILNVSDPTSPKLLGRYGDDYNETSSVYVTGNIAYAADWNDGLLDGHETQSYGTNPNSGDTDNEDLPDAWEVQYNTDATRANKMEDMDVDGLTNYEEYLNGTDPRLDDTDGDGYKDGWEVDHGYNPLDPNDPPPSSRMPELYWQILLSVIGGTIVGIIGIMFFLIRRRKGKKEKS